MHIVTFNKRRAMSLKEKEEGYVKGLEGGYEREKQCHYIIISNIKRKIKTKWSIFIFLFFLITVTIRQDASPFYYWFLLEIIEQRAQWKDAVLTKICNSIANGKRQVDL